MSNTSKSQEDLTAMIAKVMGLDPVEVADLNQLRRIQKELEVKCEKPDEVVNISLRVLQTFLMLWASALATNEDFMNTGPTDMFKVGMGMGMAVGYRKATEDLA